MSIPSLGSNLENLSSAYFDSKQSKHLGSSEVFQTFLLNSPYTSSTKIPQPLQQRSNYFHQQKEDTSHNIEDVLEYLSPQKRSCLLLSEQTSAILPKTKRLEEGESYCSMPYIDLYDIPAISKSAIKETAEECGEEIEGTLSKSMNKKRKLKASQTFSRGFECPNLENLDQATRSYIEGLQERIVQLEGKMVTLKRDNHELATQNKKHEDRMIAVLQEQERVAKTRDDYEKKIASLRDNCVNNQAIADSLKGILKMQEGEFYERVVKKDQKAKSMPNTKGSKSFVKIPSKQFCSVPSIDLDTKEAKTPNERKKISVRVGTAKSVSKNSITSVCTKNCSMIHSNKNVNCFMTTEVPM